MELTNAQDIKELLGRHGFHFSRSMGQNFLIDSRVPRNIAEAAGLDPTCAALEIGPGIGPLTEQLALRAGRVAAVELDRSLLPVLAETMAPYPNVEIIPGDIMKLDLSALCADKFNGFTAKVCANLPYNITTPVLTRLLESGLFASITVMIQREAAARICAKPGTEDYGVFPLLCRYYARCTPLFDVPPSSFLPPPKVTSTVIQFVPWDASPVAAPADPLFRLIKAAFAQRRKTLLNAMCSVYGGRPKEELRAALTSCGLSETVRGEVLTLEQFSELVLRLEKGCTQ